MQISVHKKRWKIHQTILFHTTCSKANHATALKMNQQEFISCWTQGLIGKREYTVVKILMPKIHKPIHVWNYVLLGCEKMMVVFYLLSFVFLYEPMEKMANSDSSVKQRVDLKSGQLEDNKFRGSEVAHLYLNGLLFCLNWSPAPKFWHPGRIQLPQLCSSMNSKSLLPVPVDAHHQRGSVTL